MTRVFTWDQCPKFYRVLEENQQVKEHRVMATHPARAIPELVATAPGQVLTWDITKLAGPVKGKYFDCYLMIDIYSRFIVGVRVRFTHYRHRSAYKLLEKLSASGHLFTFIDPPDGTDSPIKATTNCLEGGVNAQIKALARHHRGMFHEHQRIAVDWWLYMHTQLPDDPVAIAEQQKWGQDGLTKVTDLINQHTPDFGREDGRPAGYYTGIEPTPTNYGATQGMAREINPPTI